MTAAAETLPGRPPRARVPAPIVVAIGAVWALSLAASETGRERLLHQHGQVGNATPLWAATLLFVLAWQAMLVSMMLPSSLPLVRLFAAAARGQQCPGRALAAFLGGYAAVWSLFGVSAFFADVAIHRLLDASAWLAPRPWLFGGSTLMVAGAFQFSKLKDRCLQKCRLPGPFLLANYRRGMRGGFRVGWKHGLVCLGCCWALMLVMFGLGVAVLWWMAALTVLMVYEKTGRFGSALVRPAGALLLAVAVLQLAHPGWLPTALGGSKAFASSTTAGHGRFRVGAYEVDLSVDSAHAFGAGAVAVRLSHGGRPVRGARIRATLAMLDMEMPSVSAPLSEGRPGRYRASTPALGMAGRWGMRIDVRPPGGSRFSVDVVDEVRR